MYVIFHFGDLKLNLRPVGLDGLQYVLNWSHTEPWCLFQMDHYPNTKAAWLVVWFLLQRVMEPVFVLWLKVFARKHVPFVSRVMCRHRKNCARLGLCWSNFTVTTLLPNTHVFLWVIVFILVHSEHLMASFRFVLWKTSGICLDHWASRTETLARRKCLWFPISQLFHC